MDSAVSFEEDGVARGTHGTLASVTPLSPGGGSHLCFSGKEPWKTVYYRRGLVVGAVSLADCWRSLDSR